MTDKKKFLFIEPYYGISGDMFVASLIALGAGTKEFFDAINNFDTEGKYSISVENVNRAGIEAKLFKVILNDTANNKEKDHHSNGKTLEEIEKIINGNNKLPADVKKKSFNLFKKLAEAEKKVHFKKEKVHFHEVGAIDSIIDICAAIFALDILKIEKIYTTSVNIGYGTVKTDHGMIPIPSPAASELLKNIPVFVNEELPEFEFTTPTGALIISQLCDFRKEMKYEFLFEKTAYGAGSHNFTLFPNILRASICSSIEKKKILHEKNTEDVYVIESIFDDATGEEMAFLKESILNAGALDCIILPASGKKTDRLILFPLFAQ
ncbi:MAG TPA: LarC family nickel insertion protein [Victivallales bacterium]|nr:LarC family nickel insertion protein [Victivallales bacterium]HRR28001.1 LarC family nickel insertion protein [Victivallales bacterium]HRU01830.1 LarC family nickel insertion protein [Victivallales bacterium]